MTLPMFKVIADPSLKEGEFYMTTEAKTSIRANELRIGNILNRARNGAFMLIRDDLQSDEFWEDLLSGQILPIHLTPPILEKCGFVLVNGVYWTYYPISLEQLENDTEYFDVTKGIGMNRLDLCVQHLHQLQNLYFALTGEELDIKL